VTTDSGSSTAAVRGSPIAAIGVGPNLDPRIYYLSADEHVQELAWVGEKWTQSDVTVRSGDAEPAMAGAPIAARGVGDNLDPHVYYVTQGGYAQELAWVGQWTKGLLGN